MLILGYQIIFDRDVFLPHGQGNRGTPLELITKWVSPSTLIFLLKILETLFSTQDAKYLFCI
jgi:hypothetical protein